jgi:hypothetical protein
MKLNSKRVAMKSPGVGTLIYYDTFYTQKSGGQKMSYRVVETRNDLMDSLETQFSEDHGKTWGPTVDVPVFEKKGAGALRRHVQPGWVDPVNGRLVTTLNEAFMPNDDAFHDGMRQTYLRYRVSTDGGKTTALDEVIVQKGHTADKPFVGVTVGKNAIMLGDKGSMLVRTQGGNLLVPAQICPVGPDGEYINPGGGYTYHYSVCLIGRWNDERPGAKDLGITWDLSTYVENDPAISTRGAIEPTVMPMGDGRVLMVCRGSNGGKKDEHCKLPSYRWYAVSEDEGKTWGPLKPWTYENGEAFYSPSSMSQLVGHPNGKVYWVGNISPENCRANSPRYPLVVGEVDPGSLLLKKGTVTTIDTRGPEESEKMTISNFSTHVDRETGEIVVYASRWMLPVFTGDSYEYRVGV